jgi:hypothetical protein
MNDLFPPITLMAVIYHESGRPSVAAGSTLAHSLGQGRPFAEFAEIRPEARRGRELTAERLLQRFLFLGLHTRDHNTQVEVEDLARAIHECERKAIELGLVVVVLDPPRPWIEFDALPEQAQEGRRNQARYLLERFVVVAR